MLHDPRVPSTVRNHVWTVLFAVFMSTFLLLAYRSEVNDTRITRNVFLQCQASNRAADGTNAVLDALIGAVRETKSLPATEKSSRLARYERVKVPMLVCSP